MSELPEGQTLPCKHLNFVLLDEDEVGTCTCRACGTHLCVAEAFNNLQSAVYAEYVAMKRAAEIFERKGI